MIFNWLLNHSVPQFPHLYNEDNCVYFGGQSGGLNELMYVEHLEHRERMETRQHVTVISGGSSVILPRVWVSKDIAVFFPSANTSQHTLPSQAGPLRQLISASTTCVLIASGGQEKANKVSPGHPPHPAWGKRAEQAPSACRPRPLPVGPDAGRWHHPCM